MRPKGSMSASGQCPGPLCGVEVVTDPFPSFPTDLQPPLAAALVGADGTSKIRETVFDDRLQYVDQLVKMGADITLEGQTALIRGPTPLVGSEVKALDIRSGAALILAALAAEGKSVICNMGYIDRGYGGIDTKLNQLGARIERTVA